MVVRRTLRHLVACGVILSAPAGATAALGAFAVWSSPVSAAPELLPDDPRARAEVVRQLVRGSRFCSWYSQHRLCMWATNAPSFCDQRPDHPLCDDGDDGFCSRRPAHPRCQQPPSPS